MMDTAKLLAELDADDEQIRGLADHPLGMDSYAVYVLPRHMQQLREALARIAELEAVVVPLERLLKVGSVRIENCGTYCVMINGVNADDCCGETFAEALAAAVKAMEDAT